MHHHHQHVHRAPKPELTTQDGLVMSVVYVTAQPTFTGVIGGYSTATENDTPTTTTQRQQATAAATSQTEAAPSTTVSVDDPETATSSTASVLNLATVGTSSTSATAAVLATSSTAAISTTLATSSSRHVSSSYTNTAVAGAATTDASTSSSSTSSSQGMSQSAKAGLAVGIICVISAIAALCLFLLAKKRRQREQQARADNEKNELITRPAVVAPAMISSPNAPRLSLRPVSRLVPELMGGSQSKSRLSQGNMLTTFNESSNGTATRTLTPITEPAVAQAHHAVTHQSAVQENPFQDPQNPFADPEKGVAPVHVTTESAYAASGGPAENVQSTTLSTNAPAPELTPAQSGSVAGPPRSHIPAPIAVPTAATVSNGAPSPVIAPGPGPDLPPQGNVYRILMDFNPTMEDELGLRAGQHVRLLHEYDDGWALCIRLDRSQQGVVPRTCLAPRPSKPRPTPAPRGPPLNVAQPFRGAPGPRPRMSPAPSRPMTPNDPTNAPPQMVKTPPSGDVSSSRPTSAGSRQGSTRSVSPGAFNQAPRPLSPGPRPQKRSMSPGPYGGASGPKPMAGVSQRRRSNSASALSVRERRNSPPGPSKLGPGLPLIRSNSPGLAI